MGRRAKVSTKLTDELASQIASSPDSFPEFTWDNAITGFGIRRYPSGKVSWIIKVKTRVKVLGRVGELSEVEARINALMIIKDGVPAPQPQIGSLSRSSICDLVKLHTAFLSMRYLLN